MGGYSELLKIGSSFFIVNSGIVVVFAFAAQLVEKISKDKGTDESTITTLQSR